MPLLRTGISQAGLVTPIGVSRLTVSGLIHGKRGVTAGMAARIANAVGEPPEASYVCKILLACGRRKRNPAIAVREGATQDLIL